METPWFLDPRFLGPAIASLISLIIAILTSVKQAKKDRVEIDISQAKTAIEIAQEVREQLTIERNKSEVLESKIKDGEKESEKNQLRILALESKVDFLMNCINTLIEQLKENGIEPKCGPEKYQGPEV